MKRHHRGARWFREDIVAWVVFILAISSLAVASNYWLYREILPKDRVLSGSVPDPKIVVLAFDRVVTDPAPNKIDREQLRGHLVALEEAGFVAVTLDALARFYEHGEPLPAKSLVLTFDHGYLSTYTAVDPLLRELGWPAVLFLMTERQEQRDSFFVYWDRVSRMLASGLWEVGSHGHRGHTPIAVDAEGNEGPFFMRSKWLDALGRAENLDEFSTRVRADHERARALLEENAGSRVLAYAPPLRDVVGLSPAPEAYRTTSEIVDESYRLAFLDDRFGINDQRSNPKRLKRLRVRPSWSSQELSSMVRYGLGDEPEARDFDGDWRASWVSSSGESEASGEELVVAGYRRTDAWRAGSQWIEDWELEGEILTDGGELWIVQENDFGSEQWRFGGTNERTYLQIRSPGRPATVVESYPSPFTSGGWQHVKLIKRGAGIWAEVDGKPVAAHPTLLPGHWRGNVGIVHWSDGDTSVRLRRLRFRAIPFEIRVLHNDLPVDEIQAAIHDAPYLAAISPRLFELRATGIERAPIDRELMGVLTHRFGWEMVPTLRIPVDNALSSDAAVREIQALWEAEALSGLRIEWVGAPNQLREVVESFLEEHRRDLGVRDGRLVIAESETQS